MLPSEAWSLAPCEIVWWLSARGEARTVENFEFGRLMAVAFNNPKILGQEIREWQQAKRLQAIEKKGGIESVAEMFRMAGVHVVDRTSGDGA